MVEHLRDGRTVGRYAVEQSRQCLGIRLGQTGQRIEGQQQLVRFRFADVDLGAIVRDTVASASIGQDEVPIEAEQAPE